MSVDAKARKRGKKDDKTNFVGLQHLEVLPDQMVAVLLCVYPLCSRTFLEDLSDDVNLGHSDLLLLEVVLFVDVHAFKGRLGDQSGWRRKRNGGRYLARHPWVAEAHQSFEGRPWVGGGL